MFNLAQTFQSGFAQIKFGMKKNSPEILTGLGIAGVVGGVVLACRATLKINDILDEHKENMEKIHNGVEDHPDEYTVEDQKQDTFIQYTQTTFKIIKLYAPSALLIGGALFAFVRSNVILKQRYMGAIAAFTSLKELFSQYRKRVVDEYGEDVDKHLYYNTKIEEIETEETNENGKTKKKKKKVEVDDPNADSDYVKYFTPSNPNWDSNPEYCRMFLEKMQNYWYNKLIVDRDVVLNDVYKSLGFRPTQAGMVCGWHYDKDNPTGDNEVIFTVNKVNVPDENGGYVTGYRIDFNVDGGIQNVFGTNSISKNLAFVV